jgi:hypothetical protein
MTNETKVTAPVDDGMVMVTITKLGADKIATGEPGDGYELNAYYPNKAKVLMAIELAARFEDLGWVVVD